MNYLLPIGVQPVCKIHTSLLGLMFQMPTQFYKFIYIPFLCIGRLEIAVCCPEKFIYIRHRSKDLSLVITGKLLFIYEYLSRTVYCYCKILYWTQNYEHYSSDTRTNTLIRLASRPQGSNPLDSQKHVSVYCCDK